MSEFARAVSDLSWPGAFALVGVFWAVAWAWVKMVRIAWGGR